MRLSRGEESDMITATSWIVPRRGNPTQRSVTAGEAEDKCECLRHRRQCAMEEERASIWQSAQSWHHTPEREKWVSLQTRKWKKRNYHGLFHVLYSHKKSLMLKVAESENKIWGLLFLLAGEIQETSPDFHALFFCLVTTLPFILLSSLIPRFSISYLLQSVTPF